MASKITSDLTKEKEIYRFTPLDIASYIKWSHLQGEQEYRVITDFWELHRAFLDKSCGSRFETFKKRIYDELHALWKRDFVNEHCPLSRALDLKKQAPRLLNLKEASLELYLKLLAIHLRLTKRLPMVSVQWSEALAMCGIKKASASLWQRIEKAFEALHLLINTTENSVYTKTEFLDNKPLSVSLKD